MNKPQPMQIRVRHLPVLALVTGLGLICASCNPKGTSTGAIDQTEAIKRLDYRLQQLERRLGETYAPGTDQGDKTPIGPVKSLTLRLGTVDDRLRIYWADGTTSNLPCTEEQKTWVCG